MLTLNKLKQIAESKGLKFEVNKWDPTLTKSDLREGKTPDPSFMKVEIGICYRNWTWAWWESTITTEEDIEKGELMMHFRNSYNQKMGAEDKSWKRGYSVENQLLKNI